MQQQAVLTEAVMAMLTTLQLAVKVVARAKKYFFETKQSTIGDNSRNNQPVATKSSGNWQQQTKGASAQ